MSIVLYSMRKLKLLVCCGSSRSVAGLAWGVWGAVALLAAGDKHSTSVTSSLRDVVHTQTPNVEPNLYSWESSAGTHTHTHTHTSTHAYT